MQSREQRQGQSNRNEDLSDFIGTAWYVAGTWFVTGEDKDDNINARRPLFRGGIGAIELAVRYEELGFDSASKTGTAFTNPRADHLVPNTDKALDVRRELDHHQMDACHGQRDPRAVRGCDARAGAWHDVVLVGLGSAEIVF